jgi:dolichol-phosphate mannosyltransferase
VPAFRQHEYAPKSRDYCICVFVINEGQRLLRQLDQMRSYSSSVDIVIADGGSTDGSTGDKSLRSRGVNTLLVKTGPGQLGSQMRMAFAWAMERGYEGVITMDGNGKDGVAAIPRFIGALDEEYDHVQGSRFLEGGGHENTPWNRLLGLKLVHVPMMRWASGFRYTDTTNGFRAYSARLLCDPQMAVFRDILTGYELHYYLAIRSPRLGYRCTEVPVTRNYPLGVKAPTKISPIRGNLRVIGKLLCACWGKYDPR